MDNKYRKVYNDPISLTEEEASLVKAIKKLGIITKITFTKNIKIK